jgi:methylated-DNA-[protein]-cysteine S-methyltransferase
VTLVSRIFASPVGALTLVAGDRGLVAILWEDDDPLRVRLGDIRPLAVHPILDMAERQLSEYFAGGRTAFDLPLDFRGTDFQKQVWAALLAIPFGETRSYAQIARAIGRPTLMAATRYRSSRLATASSARTAR